MRSPRDKDILECQLITGKDKVVLSTRCVDPQCYNHDMSDKLTFIIDLLQSISPKVEALQSSSKLNISSKGKNDILTQADLYVDDFLISKLKSAFPGIDFLTEESVATWRIAKKDFSNFADNKSYWLIDAIDGTANYAVGSPNYAISIALVEDGQVVLGAIARPAYGEIYFSSLGESTFQLKNGQTTKLHVSPTSKLDESRVALEPTGRKTLRPIFLPIVEKLLPHVADPRSLGSSATHCCLLAKGEIDAMQSPGYPWDMSAGALIIQNAGGVVCQLDGGQWTPLSPDGLFCNSIQLQKEILSLLRD